MLSTLSPTALVAIDRAIGTVADSSACFSSRCAFSVWPQPAENSTTCSDRSSMSVCPGIGPPIT